MGDNNTLKYLPFYHSSCDFGVKSIFDDNEFYKEAFMSFDAAKQELIRMIDNEIDQLIMCKNFAYKIKPEQHD